MRYFVMFSLVILASGKVPAQNYPDRPIRIFAGGVGGGSDITARLIAQGVSSPLGQPMIVDNRGGGDPVQLMAKTPPDGYTLLTTGNSLWTDPLLRKASFDPLSYFTPITLATTQSTILVVHPSLPVNSLKELIALAKAKSGQLNYAAGSVGAAGYMAAELFKSLAGVNIVSVLYKGNTNALNAVITGETQLMFASESTVNPHVNSGRLKLLASSGAEPATRFPNLPTVAASGLPGFESTQVNGMFAPAGTPGAIITLLNQEMVRFLKSTEGKARFFSAGVEAVGSSPEVFATAIKSDMARLSKLIRDTGIKIE